MKKTNLFLPAILTLIVALFAEVMNNATDNFGYRDFNGAYMVYDRVGSQLELKNGYVDNFPLRNTSRLYDTSFKLEEVKAYEAAHGMKPAMNHPQTKLSTVSGYTDLYESFAFEPETKTNDPGSLQTVVYFFNIPGLVDPTTGNPRDDMSHDPALAGTVGFRADFYKDANCAYRITPSWSDPEWDEFNPRSSTIKAGMKVGFESASVDQTYGVCYFIRETEEVAIMQPQGKDIFTLSFFRSKPLVDSVRKKPTL